MISNDDDKVITSPNHPLQYLDGFWICLYYLNQLVISCFDSLEVVSCELEFLLLRTYKWLTGCKQHLTFCKAVLSEIQIMPVRCCNICISRYKNYNEKKNEALLHVPGLNFQPCHFLQFHEVRLSTSEFHALPHNFAVCPNFTCHCFNTMSLAGMEWRVSWKRGVSPPVSPWLICSLQSHRAKFQD